MNFVFISPNFPRIYSHFVKALASRGVRVLGIGDEPFDKLNPELKQYLTEYCYVSDMNRYDWMRNTLGYLSYKYGHIDYIESNNEYWMENDAKLREEFGVTNGYRYQELLDYKRKSSMKKYFSEAGVKVARYIIVSSLEESKKFVAKVGYPVFAKPDSGVGASSTFKIDNEEDLIAFHNNKLSEEYIMEEYLEGYIVTFDGIANEKSEAVISFNETFPTPIADVVRENKDVYYFARSKMDDSFRKMGEKVVKAFNLKSRCFHIEFFKLTRDKPGLAKKGDIVALEANLRSPGGDTPELLNLVSKVNYYETYAEMIVNQIGKIDNETNKVSISVNRKNDFKYVESNKDIYSFYEDNIVEHGYYPPSFRDAMGDEFYIGLFDSLEEANKFQKFVHNKQ